MSGMKELQHESKPYYIPEAPNPKVIHDKSYQLGPEDVIVNPFKVHPFETNEPESVKSKFQAINLSNYGHDDRPLLSSSTYEEDEEINDEEDYYDDNGDFDQYDMEGLISKLNHEKNQEETMFDSVLPKNDDHFSEHQLEEDISAPYLNDFHVKSNPPFTVFKPSITTPSPEYVPTFSKFPDFQEFEGSFDHKSNNNFEVDKSTHEYFRPDDVFGKNQITLEPGSLPDRPLEVGTVFRDLPHMKSPHPQYPKNVKEPPPPVPTTADFVSQYLKNPYGKPKRRPSKKPFPKIANPMKTILSDLKNLRKVMFNIPNAIGDLPSYMKGLVSNKASFAGRAFSDQDITLEDLFDVEAEDGASETDKTEEESKVEEEDDNSE
ncbi:Uncharacterized protein FKW44_000671 [Caligus rogercresseyi]|uniref:Uncharacterized protein n=1 Tax=Caligus rogercresseyi TaxID=217165 RepID=A0A7T8KHQ4_CALRO|nr:Uncharacterized protein FKW44_000671 [Caligus rogercresseyi]